MRTAGAYLWSADGKRFIDYLLSYGPIVVGHSDPRINEATGRRKPLKFHGSFVGWQNPLAKGANFDVRPDAVPGPPTPTPAASTPAPSPT